MGMSWFGIVRRRFLRPSPQETTIVLHTTTTAAAATATEEENTPKRDENNVALSSSPTHKKELSKEDIAATKIQAIFRGHLARRAFRALKSLVKLQAVVRGVCVRRQARIALDCMHALARLQITVRARQLLSR